MGLVGVLCIWIAVRIEIMNQRAGGVLPRDFSNYSMGEKRKWRSRYQFNEENWRYVQSTQRDDDSLLTRDLTEDEQKEMVSTVAQARAENDLRAIVGTWGILQYPLAVTAGIYGFCTIYSRKKWDRVYSYLLAVIGIGCLVLAMYRAYFSSMGC